MNRMLRTGTGVLLLACVLALTTPRVRAQQPTPDIPTVTSTPSAPIGRATTENPTVRVRSGPHTSYEQIGFLLPGQEVPILGRTPGGDWLKIVYPGVPGNAGWVFAPLIVLPPDATLPIVGPPPTPTPAVTPTVNPTLAAQFVGEIPPTRLPTFTPPAPLVIPTFEGAESASPAGGVPMGLVIIVLAVVGFFGLLISFVSGR